MIKGIIPFFVDALLSGAALAGTAQDSGHITQLYANDSGGAAILLDGGFPNSVATSQCPTANSFEGSTTANNFLKAALMTAKATGSAVVVTTQGCAQADIGSKLSMFTSNSGSCVLGSMFAFSGLVGGCRHCK